MIREGLSELQRETEWLRRRLAEAEQTLEAIRAGQVDSLVVETPEGLQVYALEGASNTYRVLIEAMNEGAATLSNTGVVLYSNSRFARMLDTPLQRFMGSSIHQHVVEGSKAALEALLRAAETEESRGELMLRNAAGEAVPAYLSATMIRGEGRPVLCVVAVDLRDQKRNEETLAAERLASSVLTQAAEAIIVCDQSGKVTRASTTAVELCGQNPLMLPFHRAFPVTTAHREGAAARDVVAAALRGETFRTTPVALNCAGGRAADLLLSAGPLYGADGRVIGCVITLVDVTEHRRAERALLESEARLREADQRKNEFLAVLSHELRNPLAPIVTALQIIERSGADPEQFKRAFAVINRQVHQLARIVDDLLDITRIARGRVELKRERLELGELVARAVEDYRPFFQRAGVALEMEAPREPLYVDADPTRLTQVIGNLLHNAGKFAGRGESTTVTLDRSDGYAAISIRDTGPGLSPEMASRLFEPFAQGDATLARSKGGLGLGLALVKGLVDMHGGHVEARGTERGAEFTVRLPVVPSGEAQARAPALRDGAAHRRILIIEDNQDAADSLRELLELDDHEVEVAHDGPTGIARAEELHPDVVLCDVGLPGMDGYEVAQAFRSRPELRSTYLVAITGYAMHDDYVKARRAGFDWHMAKPPDQAELEQVLARMPS